MRRISCTTLAFMLLMLALLSGQSGQFASAAGEGPIGWASYDGGTTGGTGGVEKTFVSLSDMQAYFKLRESNNPDKRITEKVIVYIDGTMSGSDKLDIKNTANVSIIGRNNAKISFMINIVRSQNIIVKNITSSDCSDDGLCVDSSTNVWVDHCTFMRAYDGLLDIKNGSNYVTVSWNHFKEHKKTALCGHSANNGSADSGKLKVTYHHNWFEGTNSRHPRVRFGQVHVYNNFFDRLTDYGVASTCDAEVLVEGNYFASVKRPVIWPQPGTDAASTLSNDPAGKVKERSNYYDSGSGQPMVNDSGFSFSPPYSYALDNAGNVPSLLRQYAGAEKSGTPPDPEEPEEPIDPEEPAEVAAGDVNGDGSINSLDCAMMKMYLIGAISSFPYPQAADVDKSGSVNSLDYLYMQKYVLGLISEFPGDDPGPQPTDGDIYASPNGSGSAGGTISNPTTLEAAIALVKPGGTIYLRGGTYSFSTQLTIARGNDGQSGKMKKIFAYGEEKPVLDFSSQPYGDVSSNYRGLQINAHYWHVKGIEVKGSADNGIFIGGSYNIIEKCEAHRNRDTGIQLGRYSSGASKSEWPSHNQIIDCVSHNNMDPDDGEDADGFACKLTTGDGNKFINCVAYNNVDDGWDLYTKSDTGAIGAVYLENCTSYKNGVTSDGSYTADSDGNGFKLGGEDIAVNHTVKNCTSYSNKKHGFTYNRNTGTITMTGNKAYQNGQRNFSFEAGTHIFSKNVSTNGGANDKIVGVDDGTNQWYKK
ncbi:pectate lyase [Anaerobacterium chartisolvens]|uniref:Probable pectate lyase C n=1 Tax=Anaerobacterium chartisolvens TaxID=1297424 RepID=A0A369B9C7_9FIRM|nr:right-handed parallel beta-helix repeat-containing protein [Anaerobacterium chartisolvens]RCX17925.1 pectate lyase [Anaerobacterium chartisolvens]